MVSVGVGSEEWWELDSPREWDKPNSVIFLKAPEIFHPSPFMLATRTNKNEREQLDSGYVSEMKMKLLPESCSSKCVDNLAAKKWERERVFLRSNLSQNPMETRARMCERGWEWREWAWELITPLSASIWTKLGECTWGGARHNGQEAVGEGGAQEPLALGQPTCGVGRP